MLPSIYKEGKLHISTWCRKNWVRIHWHLTNIFLPIVPFLIGGIIRAFNTNMVIITTFSASDLAICLAFLCFNIYQSILTEKRPLDNDDKVHEAGSYARIFQVFCIVSVLLFGANVSYTSSLYDLGLNNFTNTLRCYTGLTFVWALLVFYFSDLAQKTFRLKAII